MNKSLIAIKNIYKFGSGHVSAVSSIMRYPITLDSLLVRIYNLAKQYNQQVEPKVLDLSKGKVMTRYALKGRGGLYIWHNKTTGLFYLGSALRFFDKEGRLNDYFMPGRVQQSISTTVDKSKFK